MKLREFSVSNKFLLIVIAGLALLTSSFDLFLVVKIGGFSFRATNLLAMVLIVVALNMARRESSIALPMGYKWLLGWGAVLTAFAFNTNDLERGVSYTLLMWFAILTVYAFSRVFNTERKIIVLHRLYLWSFILVGVFGVLQALSGILHLPIPFIVDRWLEGLLVRVNAFSYEPSYYATYMLLGFVYAGFLMHYSPEFRRDRLTQWACGLSGLSILLSVSRMGWLVAVFFPVLIFWLRRGQVLSCCKAHKLASMGGVVLVAGASVVFVALSDLTFLFQGLGFFGHAGASKDIRLNELYETLCIFTRSPWIGYGIGGIPSAIGALYGYTVTNNMMAKYFEGMSIFAQVLAAGGVVGFALLVIYFGLLLVRGLRAPQSGALPAIARALAVSLIFEFIILQMNQNILRAYLWYAIAFLSAVVTVIYRVPEAKA